MTPPPNPLLLQTLALTLSEVDQYERCTLRIRRDSVPIGSGATLELCWNDGSQDVAISLLGLVSRDANADTQGLAREYAELAIGWLCARGWQRDRELVLKRVPIMPVPILDDVMRTAAEKRLAPYLNALRSESTCLITHEYSYETRGGLALVDEVALRWGTQSRMLRSKDSNNPTQMETLFPAGEQLAGETVAYLLEKGWKLLKRERQAQGASTLSNEAATNIAVTFHLQGKKRFGLF